MTGKTIFLAVVSSPITWIIVAALVAAYLIFGQYQSCSAGNWTKKATNANQNIQNSAVNAAVSEATANATEKQVNKSEGISNEKGNISNQAAVNFNAAVDRPSSSFSNNASDARANFCRDRDNAGDPLCRNR
jgi:hypothetical protein